MANLTHTAMEATIIVTQTAPPITLGQPTREEIRAVDPSTRLLEVDLQRQDPLEMAELEALLAVADPEKRPKTTRSTIMTLRDRLIQ
jgi:hypothetical protein